MLPKTVMGGSSSKEKRDTTRNPRSNDYQSFACYEEARKSCPDLQEFDLRLTQSTTRAITELAGIRKQDGMDFLRVAMDYLMEGNNEVVKLILRSQEGVMKDPNLRALVEEYLDSSLETLKICTALDKCIDTAKYCQFLIKEAVRQFDESPPEERVPKTLLQLQRFQQAGDPFTKEFSDLFRSVYVQQLSMLTKLRERKSKLDKKMKTMQIWRKVSNVLFVATFASVLVLSVVAAAVAAGPVFVAITGALTVPIGSIGKWCNTLWDKYMQEVKNELELVELMELSALIRVSEVANIDSLIKQLELKVESIQSNAEVALIDEGAIAVVIDEIRRKLDSFTEALDELGQRAGRCRTYVKQARVVILNRIINGQS